MSTPNDGGAQGEIVWFARGGHVKKMGPYRSQTEATNALRLAGDRESFPADAFVWPEPKESGR